jgi:hypothetical protein
MGRRDAARVKGAYDFNALYPYIMKKRNESIVLFSDILDAEPILAYLQAKKDAGTPVTFFQVFLLALIRVLKERPAMNRYVIGRRIYQRKDVNVTFIAKRAMTDEASETTVNVRVKDDDTFNTLLGKISGSIRSAKEGADKDDDKLVSAVMRMPRFFLRAFVRTLEWVDFYFDTPKFLRGVDPMRCSAFVANLGSVGIEAPYHHLYEWGTCSMFVAIGRIKPTPYVTDDGTVAAKRMVEIKVSMDERIADGFYCARSLELLRHYLSDPALPEAESRSGDIADPVLK